MVTTVRSCPQFFWCVLLFHISLRWAAGHRPHRARWWWGSVWWRWRSCCESIHCRKPTHSSGPGSSCFPPPPSHRTGRPAASGHPDTGERGRCAPRTERWTLTREGLGPTWLEEEMLSLCDRGKPKKQSRMIRLYCTNFTSASWWHYWDNSKHRQMCWKAVLQRGQTAAIRLICLTVFNQRNKLPVITLILNR